MNEIEALRAIKARILRHGWQQGGEHTTEVDNAYEGCLCLIETLAVVLFDKSELPRRPDPVRFGTYGRAASALREEIAEVSLYTGIIGWNDAPGRTEAEVLALIDRAIARLENGGSR